MGNLQKKSEKTISGFLCGLELKKKLAKMKNTINKILCLTFLALFSLLSAGAEDSETLKDEEVKCVCPPIQNLSCEKGFELITNQKQCLGFLDAIKEVNGIKEAICSFQIQRAEKSYCSTQCDFEQCNKTKPVGSLVWAGMGILGYPERVGKAMKRGIDSNSSLDDTDTKITTLNKEEIQIREVTLKENNDTSQTEALGIEKMAIELETIEGKHQLSNTKLSSRSNNNSPTKEKHKPEPKQKKT